METLYLRFTNDIDSDKCSYLKTPSMKKAKKLPGLCAFNSKLLTDGENIYSPSATGEMDAMSKSEISDYVESFRPYYIEASVSFSLFTGKFIDTNINGEGVIVKKTQVIF